MWLPILKKVIIYLLWGAFMTSTVACHHAVWLDRSTPLGGQKSGILWYKNNPTRKAAYKQAAEFCAPQVSYITHEGIKEGGYSGMAVGNVAHFGRDNRKVIEFICVDPAKKEEAKND